MLTKSHQVNVSSQFVRYTKEAIFCKKILGAYESTPERFRVEFSEVIDYKHCKCLCG